MIFCWPLGISPPVMSCLQSFIQIMPRPSKVQTFGFTVFLVPWLLAGGTSCQATQGGEDGGRGLWAQSNLGLGRCLVGVIFPEVSWRLCYMNQGHHKFINHSLTCSGNPSDGEVPLTPAQFLLGNITSFQVLVASLHKDNPILANYATSDHHGPLAA